MDRDAEPGEARTPALPVWLAAVAVAATYTLFLIHDQFGFLHALQDMVGEAPEAVATVRRVMGAMGLAGLLGSLGAAWLCGRRGPGVFFCVAAGLGGGAAAALALLAVRSPRGFLVVAVATGLATALLTVSLATALDALPRRGVATAAGAGTGVAYLLCNLPPVFSASPAARACIGAAACLLALVPWLGWWMRRGRPTRALPADRARSAGEREPREPRLAVWRGLAAGILPFVALVWLDSAAFAMIQQTSTLTALTWGSPERIVLQGLTHVLGAMVAMWLLADGRLASVPWIAWMLFAVGLGTLGAFDGGTAGGALPLARLGGWLYAAGIALYSSAFVAWPALTADARSSARWRAAALFGLAGWLGSALGVGMAQDLGRLPHWAPLIALATLIVASWLGRTARSDHRSVVSVAALLILVGDIVPGLDREPSGPPAPATGSTLPAAAGSAHAGAVAEEVTARGRMVYIAEGCINCHSQFVRPTGTDPELLGPIRPLDRRARPQLIGNRRQGPDLAMVGNRRSRRWQRLHLLAPRQLVPGSRMPSYAHLFASREEYGAGSGASRGDDLVAYLDSLGGDTIEERAELVEAVDLGAAARRGDPRAGARWFAAYCAPCHGPGGRGDGLFPELFRPSLDLGKGGFWLVPGAPAAGQDAERLVPALARVVRYGIPSTDMPGHEWLTDRQVADLTTWLAELTAHPPEPDPRQAAPTGAARAVADG